MPNENNLPRRTARIRISLTAACVVAVLLSLVGYGIYKAFYERESSEWSEELTLWDGTTLPVQITSSQRIYHGHPHMFGWGGGHPWGSVTFDAGGKTYRWEGAFIPIAVQFDESGVYLVVYDRETVINATTGGSESFRIYKAASPTKWDEIPPAQFPKRLAILNTAFGAGEPTIPPLDTRDGWFRRSLTAKFWSCLESPNFDFDAEPSEDFLKQFKAKYIHTAGAAEAAQDDVEIRPGVVVHFTTAAEGARVLSTRDSFVAAMSPFDRSARLEVEREVSESEFMAFAAKQAIDWTAKEKSTLKEVLASFRAKTEALNLHFPGTILLIKTTGLEEGSAAYCRGHAIIIPPPYLSGDDDGKLSHVVYHELFHIYRGYFHNTYYELYKLIGFEAHGGIELPVELRPRKITNPDAPFYDAVIHIRVDGKKVAATPVLFSETPLYDKKTGGPFFKSLVFRLMVLDDTANGLEPSLSPDGKPRLIDPSDAPDYLDQVGRNTQYIIHPEEILAENFALMVEGASPVANPEIIEGMRKVLTK